MRCASFVLSGFCLVALPFAVSDSLNQDKRQHVTTFIANLAVLQQRMSAMPEAPQRQWGKVNEFDETCHCLLVNKLSKHDDQLSSKDKSASSWTTSQRLENMFYRNISRASSGHLVTVKANRYQLPIILRPQRQEVTYMMWLIDDDDRLTASTVTGQTGSPLAETEPEVEEETNLFLKTIAKTSCGLLCVLDNVVI